MNYPDDASIGIEDGATRHALSQHLTHFDFADAGLRSNQADETWPMVEPVARCPMGIANGGDGIAHLRRRGGDVELEIFGCGDGAAVLSPEARGSPVPRA